MKDRDEFSQRNASPLRACRIQTKERKFRRKEYGRKAEAEKVKEIKGKYSNNPLTGKSNSREMEKVYKSPRMQKIIKNYMKLRDYKMAGALSNVDEETARKAVNSPVGQKMLAEQEMVFIESEADEFFLIGMCKRKILRDEGKDIARYFAMLYEMEMKRGTLDKAVLVKMVDTFDELSEEEQKKEIEKLKKEEKREEAR